MSKDGIITIISTIFLILGLILVVYIRFEM